jgi:hypothetical protein
VGGNEEGGFEEMESKMRSILQIDLRERNASPLDDIVEENIVRHWGLVISEDDFSASGALTYVPPSVGGKPSDYTDFVKWSGQLARLSHRSSKRNGEEGRGCEKDDQGRRRRTRAVRRGGRPSLTKQARPYPPLQPKAGEKAGLAGLLAQAGRERDALAEERKNWK